ncbi:MAG: hypothetical protein LBT17_01155 [Mycoplasmataceae bacterium]|jgi:hypothetical protein|nr:hypothetical protein [Mycoplasmataceae bacterium]
MSIIYNVRKKMIKIEQYNRNPKRVGHELMISTTTIRGPQQPRISLDERIAKALTTALKPVVTRLDKIETTLTTVIKLNNLKTE